MRRSREQRPFMTEIKRSRLNPARHPGMMSGDQSEFPIDETPSDLPEVDINEDSTDPGLEAAMAAADAVFGKNLAAPVVEPQTPELPVQAEPAEIAPAQADAVEAPEPRILPSILNVDPLAERLAEAEKQDVLTPAPKNPRKRPARKLVASVRKVTATEATAPLSAPVQIDIEDLIAERTASPASRRLANLSTRHEPKNIPVRFFFNPRRIGVAQRMARKTTQKEALPLRAGERWKRRLSVYAR